MPVSVDLIKLSDVVNNDIVKKAVYGKLTAKVNNFDSSLLWKLNFKETKKNRKKIS